MQGGGTPKVTPCDVSLDVPAYLPDEFIPSQDAKLDVYRRLSAVTTADAIGVLHDEVRDRFGPLPPPAEAFFSTATLRLVGGTLGIDGILVRGDEARVTFRDTAVPRMKGLSAAFHEVQFQAEVRRTHPLSLKLTRVGGSPILEGLVRALRGLAAA